jgi:hypothetical protein
MTQRGTGVRPSPASDQVGDMEVVLVCPGWQDTCLEDRLLAASLAAR